MGLLTVINNKLQKMIFGNNLPFIITKKGSVTLSLEDDVISLGVKGNLRILIDGEIELTSSNSINVLSESGDFCLDTSKGVVHINSRMTKQIKDLPESINYREKESRILELLQHEQFVGTIKEVVNEYLKSEIRPIVKEELTKGLENGDTNKG